MAGNATAQTNFPTKPVRIIVGFPSGGQPDTVVRLLGQKFAEAWGKPVVIENVSGAAGTIATDRVAKAAPDGYTLGLLSNAQLVINSSLYKLAFDPMKDFAPSSPPEGWRFSTRRTARTASSSAGNSISAISTAPSSSSQSGMAPAFLIDPDKRRRECAGSLALVVLLLMCRRIPYAMIARILLTVFYVSACAADTLLYQPRRHAHRVCDLRRRSAARLGGGGLEPPPQVGLGRPGIASLDLPAGAAPHAHPLRYARLRPVGP